MFATITPLAPSAARARSTTTAKYTPRRRFAAPTFLSDAYDSRLLGEVARWDDQGAFEEIFARHRTAVVRAAWEICRDADCAHDIAQQAFTALWVRAARLVAGSITVRLWLLVVARNLAVDYVSANHDGASISEAVELPSNLPSPPDMAVTAQTREQLAAAIAILEPDERLAIELIYFAGMSDTAAASASGFSVEHVVGCTQRALGRLRRYMESGAR